MKQIQRNYDDTTRENRVPPCVLKYRVPHGSQPRLGGFQIRAGLVVGLAVVKLEFEVRFPNERN